MYLFCALYMCREGLVPFCGLLQNYVPDLHLLSA